MIAARALALLLLGCGDGDPCAGYHQDPRLAAQCVVRAAADAPTVAQAGCERAGAWAEECRKAWVRAHLDRPADELVAACTTDECRFFALDHRPLPFGEQVPRCERLGAFRENCVGHAATRFLATGPDLTTQAATFAAAPRWTEVLSLQAGSFLACGGVSDCALFGAAAPLCERRRSQPHPPDLCASFRPDFPKVPDPAGG